MSSFTILQRARVTRLCAVWLVVLAALPFTAPFAAFDVSDFLGGGTTHQAATTVAAPASASAPDDSVDDTAMSEAALHRTLPTAHSGLVRIASPVEGDFLTSAPTRFAPVASSPSTHDSSALAVTLRL
jgi:hypothetical protein